MALPTTKVRALNPNKTGVWSSHVKLFSYYDCWKGHIVITKQ